ncbi:hypothetical protein O3M35_004512 [Rhynocoris fuscipes]|uniref:Uncharacterized protein n=1 Tax=Rhynocoris fuscipes TaxID=488301 RepID=A0AAW1CHV4_9HEMI
MNPENIKCDSDPLDFLLPDEPSKMNTDPVTEFAYPNYLADQDCILEQQLKLDLDVCGLKPLPGRSGQCPKLDEQPSTSKIAAAKSGRSRGRPRKIKDLPGNINPSVLSNLLSKGFDSDTGYVCLPKKKRDENTK